MYKLNQNPQSITRLSDGASIPADPKNTDYAAYLIWVSAGNTPTPADIPVKTYAPLSAWQVRKVLTKFGVRAQVEDYVATASQEIQDAYNEPSEFQRDNVLLNSTAKLLGWTDEQVDEMFETGKTL